MRATNGSANTNSVLLCCLAASVTSFGVLYCHHIQSLKKEEDKLKAALQLAESERVISQDLTKRCAIERSEKDVLQKELSAMTKSEIERASNGYYIQTIGKVVSCFSEVVGTPRQGSFAPATKGKIVFNSDIPPGALEGLEGYSHVWVVFIFHEGLKPATAERMKGKSSTSTSNSKNKTNKNNRNRMTFTAKVTPPMLKDKTGVFATRSPHRPNPIGLSLVRVAGVNAQRRELLLSGLDLIQGTPVLDVKPYVPGSDSVCVEEARVPWWVQQGAPQRRVVTFAPSALDQLRVAAGMPPAAGAAAAAAAAADDDDTAAGAGNESHYRPSGRARLQLYRGQPDEALRALTEVLAVDVRSIRQTQLGGRALVRQRFDGVVVEYELDAAASRASPLTPQQQQQQQQQQEEEGEEGGGAKGSESAGGGGEGAGGAGCCYVRAVVADAGINKHPDYLRYQPLLA